MADRESGEVYTVASQMNQKHKYPRTAQLVERFMAEVNRFAEEDWKESDGWVAQLVLWGDEGKQTYAYELRDGKLSPSESEGPFVATITMSVETFADLIDAVLLGKAELGAERKFKARHIAYEGQRWIVDSEQLRKVFRRMGSATGAGR